MGTWLLILYGVFAALAGGTALQLWRNGRNSLDDRFTARDRRILSATALHIVVPLTVAVTLLLQLRVAARLHLALGDVTYWILGSSFVVEDDAPALVFRIALLGEVLPVAIALGLVALTRLWPVNAAWNFLRLETARLLLWLFVIFAPVLSLALKEGYTWLAFGQLREVDERLASAYLLAHGLLAGSLWWFWRRRGRRSFVRFATPLFDRLRLLQRGLARDPDNGFLLRELGRTYLAADDAEQAREPLEHAASVRPEHPETRFLAGMAALRAGTPDDASVHLRAAGEQLEGKVSTGRQRELLYEVTLGLAASRLELDDSEGARLTAEAAQAQKPGDPRALVLLADALKSLGRIEEARRSLERALGRAEGIMLYEIQRRLRRMSRS